MLMLLLLLAQTLSPEQVTSAMAEGAKLKDAPHKIGLILQGQHGGFNVWVAGPENRIAMASATAAKQYRELTPEQASEASTNLDVRILVEPTKPQWYPSGWSVTPLATGIVLKTKAGEIVRPKSQELVPAAFGNAAGGTVEGRGVMAWFSSLPEGDVDIIVTTVDTERKYTLKAKERARVR